MNGSSTTMARDRTVSRACKQSCKPSKAVASRSSRTAAPFCFLWVRRGQSARPNGYNRSSAAHRHESAWIRHFYISEKTATRDPVWARLEEEVIRPGLCSHCGTCVGLSAGKLEFEGPDDRCLPRTCGTAVLPSICYEACPQVRASYPEMKQAVLGDSANQSPFLGTYQRISSPIAPMNAFAVAPRAAGC